MRLLTAGLVCAATLLHGGVVSGVVLEQLSGVPLARSRVRLDRFDATGRVQSETVTAGRSGQFTFSGVPDGLYVLTASRDGYAPLAYGQRRSQGTGPAFEVNKETNLFTELRLRKLGVLTGRVFDENRIGIRRVGVSAYSMKPPFRSVGTAESDDRGVFRIHGLAEGKYRLRSQPFRHDDGLPLLPTFAPEMLMPRDSLIYASALDRETTDIDVTPIAGNLISVGGAVTCAPVTSSDGFVTVTLSTDTGRRQARAICNGSYQFDNLAPGNFEVFGVHSDGKLAAFHERRVFQSTTNAQLDLRPMGEASISVRDETGRIQVRTQVMLTMRRVDGAGIAETKTFPVDERASITLAPGWWEVAGKMAAPYYLSGATLYFRESEPRPTAHPDWFEVQITDRGTSVLLRASNQAGSIAGKVVEKTKGVPAIPVFLWPVAAETRRKAGGPRVLETNAAGEFKFEALPPGAYRVMASFDYDEVDDDVILAANALLVTVETSGVARAELVPYLAP
jgi:hypothetical protein